MDIELFLGRFHPLIVHLPIGFLMLAAILEGLSRLSNNKFKELDLAISITILCGGIGAATSAIIGYLLASGGGYDEQTLFWHKWLGIGLAVLALIAWTIKSKYIKSPKLASSYMIALLVILVAVTGHLGANLTHGSDYLLTYAPISVQKIFGHNIDKNRIDIPQSPDSVMVFAHIIQPALEAKCYQCHNETKRKGGLELVSELGILEGGENGQVITANNSQESPLFQRVTLPQRSKKFMPPSGEALSYGELKLMEWWINTGAEFNFKLSDAEIPNDVANILLRDYDIDASPKLIYERLTAPELSPEMIGEIVNAGFKIYPLSDGHRLYDVSSTLEVIDENTFNELLIAKEQITWLDLGGKGVTNTQMATINKLRNLTRLSLQNNPITDEGVEQLHDLVYLESLNLYGTSITDQALNIIRELPAIKRVYLWQAKVSQAGVDKLIAARPDLEVQMGYE